jgi:hypothetical protein
MLLDSNFGHAAMLKFIRKVYRPFRKYRIIEKSSILSVSFPKKEIQTQVMLELQCENEVDRLGLVLMNHKIWWDNLIYWLKIWSKLDQSFYGFKL